MKYVCYQDSEGKDELVDILYLNLQEVTGWPAENQYGPWQPRVCRGTMMLKLTVFQGAISGSMLFFGSANL